MATLTLAPERPVVRIVLQMALIAFRGQLDLVRHGFAMAGLAHDALVRPLQIEVRLPVVIEFPRLPIDDVVARLAGAAQPPLVRIVFLVTRYALHFRVFEIAGTVTLFAGQGRVRP